MKHSNRLPRIALILAISIFLMLLEGCAPSQTTSSTTPSTTKSGTTAGTTTLSNNPGDQFGKYDKPITISVLSTDPKNTATEYSSTNPKRKSASENEWIDAYSEYLNIKVDRKIAEDATALNATINTAMASGKLPDVMIVSKSMFYTLVENGVCADLTNAYKTYSTTHGKMMAEMVDNAPNILKTGTVDGKLVGFPFFCALYGNSEVLWVRQDWLSKVGMSAPKTITELEAVAKAFKDAKFDGKATIGLGLTGVPSSIMAAYGVVMDTWYQQADKSYIYSNVRDEMKAGLLAVQSMYKKGLFKNDFAVTNIIGEEIANGVVGMYYAPAWHSVTSIQANMNNDPKAEWLPYRIPSLDGGSIKQWTNDQVGQFIVVNKNCQNPEAIFKMLELEMNIYYDPTDEESLKYNYNADGFQMWNLRIFRDWGIVDKDHYKARLMIEAIDKKSDKVPPVTIDSWKLVKAGLNGDRKVYGYYLGFIKGHPIIMEQRAKGMLVGGYNGPITENMSLYEKTINEALTNAMLKVITGSDISVFENAVKTWNESGGQAITKDVNAYYKK